MKDPIDRPAATLGSYTLVELIGRGGMGEVWRAERTASSGVQRRLALKRILPQFQHDPVLRERFLAEARITARLEHPHIVQVVDFADQPEPFLVLEYVDGVSCAELLRGAANGEVELPIAAALFIVADASDALDYAHRRTDDSRQPLDIVHRDVSPPNILVSFDGVVKVNDFGVARAADNLVRTQTGLSVGKIVYMAPEQARGEPVDKRADVFALGIVLWELLAKRPLLARNEPPASTLAALDACDFPAPSRVAPGIPQRIDAIVMDALQRDPSRRTASAGRLAASLRAALHDIAPGFGERDLAQIVRAGSPNAASRVVTTDASMGGAPIPPPSSTSVAEQSPPPTTPAIVPPTAFAQPVPVPARRSRRTVIAAVAVAVALLAMGIGSAVFLSMRDDADEDDSPERHVYYQSMIAPYVVSCGLSNGMPHGHVTVSLRFDDNGRLRDADVHADRNTSLDPRVTMCIQRYLATVEAPASARGFTVDGLDYTF